MIRWSSLPTFLSISSRAFGAGCRNKVEADKDREKKIWGYKERRPPTAQASTLMTIYQPNTERYPWYMVKLSMICQGENTSCGLLHTADQSNSAMTINFQSMQMSVLTLGYGTVAYITVAHAQWMSATTLNYNCRNAEWNVYKDGKLQYMPVKYSRIAPWMIRIDCKLVYWRNVPHSLHGSSEGAERH